MSPRKRAPKPQQRERADRRAIIGVLLDRARRGALTRPESAVLADHVHAEQANADETRTQLTATTRALETARQGADAAVREIEQQRDEQHERAERARSRADELYRRRQELEHHVENLTDQLNARNAADARAAILSATEHTDNGERHASWAAVAHRLGHPMWDAAPLADAYIDHADREAIHLHRRAEEAERKLSEAETLAHRILQRAERAEESLNHAKARGDHWSAKARELEADRDKQHASARDSSGRLWSGIAAEYAEQRAAAEQRATAQEDRFNRAADRLEQEWRRRITAEQHLTAVAAKLDELRSAGFGYVSEVIRDYLPKPTEQRDPSDDDEQPASAWPWVHADHEGDTIAVHPRDGYVFLDVRENHGTGPTYGVDLLPDAADIAADRITTAAEIARQQRNPSPKEQS